MRKCALVAIMTVAALMAWPLSAMGATSNDSADGKGSTAMFPFGGDPAGPAPAQVSFSSQANFNGTEPRGSMKTTIGANTYAGDVDCVIVNGNTAIVGGYIDHALSAETFEGLPANGFLLTMVDNGSSGDQLTLEIGPSQSAGSCVDQPFTGLMTTADVSVHDG
jgi:hypothetical protein